MVIREEGVKLAFELSDTIRPVYVWCEKYGYEKQHQRDSVWCDRKCKFPEKCKNYRLAKQEKVV